MANVGVVIRTKNEGRWIRYCLQSLSEQINIDSLNLVLVDCSSTDMTIQRAQSIIPNLKVVQYDGEYFPGKSINLGIKALGDVDYALILSAHCIPIGANWLANMIRPLEDNMELAASYCRQIPTLASTPENRRDLLNTFSTESRLQKKDTFFHNAASIIRLSIWRNIPFDSSLKHIEDRHWAAEIINAGYKIYYNAIPSVIHEHGINQHNRAYRSFRGQGVSNLLIGDDGLVSKWSKFARNSSKVMVIGLTSTMESKRYKEIKDNSSNNLNCFLLPKKDANIPSATDVIERKSNWNEISLFELLREIIIEFASKCDHYDYVYFFDADKNKFRGGLPNHYLEKSIEMGADLCVAVESFKEDFFVLNSDETSWEPVNEKIMDLYNNKAHFKRALYGEGMLLRVSTLIESEMPETVFLDG